MPISALRLQQDFAAIARQSLPDMPGANRPTFSTPWGKAVKYVVEEAIACGLSQRIDAAGNIHLRPAEYLDKPVWLSGSHLDSVPNGGDFDGVAGVVVPLEILRAAKEDSLPPPPLELVIFAEEEGTTFGLGMLGSRTWVGSLDKKELSSIHNADGLNYCEAGQPFGVTPAEFANDRLHPADYIGLVEVHIEQGPAMWKQGQPVALVTAINGRQQYRVEVRGVANHAGSTGMTDRVDALAGAAEMIVSIEALPKTLSPQAVATVGRIEVHPNAINVIADQVEFTIDFRAPDPEILSRADVQLHELLQEISQRRNLTLQVTTTEVLPATAMSADICQQLRVAAQRLKLSLPETISGALHDAAILAPYVPTAMLFVASRDGISHNPAEFSRVEDIAVAAKILYELVTSSHSEKKL